MRSGGRYLSRSPGRLTFRPEKGGVCSFDHSKGPFADGLGSTATILLANWSAKRHISSTDLPFGPSASVMSAFAQARGERTLVPPNGIGTAYSPTSATLRAKVERTAQRPGGDPIFLPRALPFFQTWPDLYFMGG